MTMHVDARPAGPDAPWGPDEAPRVRANALPYDSALIFHHLRKHHPVFQALSRRAWVLFLAMGCFLRRNPLAYPSQATLAAFTGYSARTLHRATKELRAVRALLTWASRYADGRAAPLHYAYGPAALEAFDGVAAYYPRGPGPARAKVPATRAALPLSVLPAQAPKEAKFSEGTAGSPSDKMASGPSDEMAEKPLKRIQIKPCEVTSEPATSPVVPPPSPLPSRRRRCRPKRKLCTTLRTMSSACAY